MADAGLERRVGRGLERAGLETVPALAPAKLAELALLLCSWGHRVNLSGHKEPEAVVDRLILDAAALTGALPPAGSIADLGSGAGFPGLPIAVLRPECEVRLVEARERRHHFQRAAIRALGLANVRAVRARIEDRVETPAELALAQAVGPADAVLPAIAHWSVPRGTLAIPAALGATPPAVPARGFGELRTLRYTVPGGPDRLLWLVERR